MEGTMLITIPATLPAKSFTPGKKGSLSDAELPKGRHEMCVSLNPSGSLSDPRWAVLRSNRSLGLPVSSLLEYPGITVEGFLYSVLADDGWKAYSHTDATQNGAQRPTVAHGRHKFFRAQNPSGRSADPDWLVLASNLDTGMAENAFAQQPRILRLFPVFPPFLNAVSKDGTTRSHGTAVWVAQRLFAAAVHGMPLANWPPAFQINGIYDDPFRECVRTFQRFFDFPEEDLDGNLGPQTREMASHKLGIDFDDIMNDEFGAMTHTVWVDDKGDVHEWPIAA